MNRQQREEQGIQNARDLGREYYQTQPDLMLSEVAREGAMRWAWKPAEIAFLEGYQEARKQHEEFLTEKESDDDQHNTPL